MKLLFIYHAGEDRGSARDIHLYAEAARRVGHEVTLYGPTPPGSRLPYTLDTSADALVFVFEWTTRPPFADPLGWTRLLAHVPRARRIVIDCDGKYNDPIALEGDANHATQVESEAWITACNALSDTICQPTYHPQRANVRPFLFHGYNPTDEVTARGERKEYDLIYVGNNWFRWRPLSRLLRELAPVRHRLGRIAIVGHGWGQPAPWANPSLPEDAYHTDADWLRRLQVELLPPVAFTDVLGWMGQGMCSPVVYRPLFDHLQLVTCRTFETPAADTIPLFNQPDEFVREMYGPAGAELRLGDQPAEKVLDVIAHPTRYADAVCEVRRHLREFHSYDARLRELVEMLQC
jgi:hypothetical protein